MHPPSSSPSLFPACVCTKQGLKQTRSDAVSCKGPRSFVPCCVCESLFPQHMNSFISSINVYSLNVYCHYFKHWGEKKKNKTKMEMAMLPALRKLTIQQRGQIQRDFQNDVIMRERDTGPRGKTVKCSQEGWEVSLGGDKSSECLQGVSAQKRRAKRGLSDQQGTEGTSDTMHANDKQFAVQENKDTTKARKTDVSFMKEPISSGQNPFMTHLLQFNILFELSLSGHIHDILMSVFKKSSAIFRAMLLTTVSVQ